MSSPSARQHLGFVVVHFLSEREGAPSVREPVQVVCRRAPSHGVVHVDVRLSCGATGGRGVLLHPHLQG